MGWLIITFCGLLFGILIAWAEENGKSWKDPDRYFNQNVVGTVFMVALASGVIGGIVADVGSGEIRHNDDPVEEGCTPHVVTYPIISAIRDRQISGSFILGTGGVSTIDKYYAYVEYEPGLKLKTFYTRDTYIVEGDHKPHFKRTDYLCERTFRNWFWFGTAEPRRNYGQFGQLYVPSNTILREFKL